MLELVSGSFLDFLLLECFLLLLLGLLFGCSSGLAFFLLGGCLCLGFLLLCKLSLLLLLCFLGGGGWLLRGSCLRLGGAGLGLLRDGELLLFALLFIIVELIRNDLVVIVLLLGRGQLLLGEEVPAVVDDLVGLVSLVLNLTDFLLGGGRLLLLLLLLLLLPLLFCFLSLGFLELLLACLPFWSALSLLEAELPHVVGLCWLLRRLWLDFFFFRLLFYLRLFLFFLLGFFLLGLA